LQIFSLVTNATKTQVKTRMEESGNQQVAKTRNESLSVTTSQD